jgi:class 3 adenylate cyclase
MSDEQQSLAIVFADIVGAAELYDSLGDEGAQKAIEESLGHLSEAVRRNQGEIIKYIGEELMCRFDKPDHAFFAACEMQESANLEANPDLRIKVGMHYGPVIFQSGDLFGDAVNVAARMAGIAMAEQIIATQDFVEELSPENREYAKVFDRASVKGKASVIEIYLIMWESEEEITTIGAQSFHEESEQRHSMTVSLDDEVYLVRSGSPFVIGSGSQCDLALPTTLASREHVRIECRRDRFTLIDQSTNGTYVRTEDGNVVYLRREELILWGQGVISLGAPFDDVDGLYLHFDCG